MSGMTINRRNLLTVAAAAGTAGAITFWPRGESRAAQRFEVNLSEAEWKKRLTPAQFHILREEGTERPFSSPLDKEKRKGVFACAGCKLPLFASTTKFESGTGWPSFWAPLKNAVVNRSDRSLGIERIEVRCRRCGGHLGHVFDDGPRPTGKRYCMNGLALSFTPTA